jgi:hypothetical protein
VTLAAPNVRSIGVDFAAEDGNVVDFAAAKAAGATFVFLKRCQHVFPDQAAALADKARAAGLVVGLYDFPGYGPRAATAAQQVAAFDNAPGDIIPGVDLPPAIDVERSMPWKTTGWDEAKCAGFIDELVKAFADKYGVLPFVYTGFFQWDNLKRPALPEAAKCPLWIKTAYRLSARQPVDQVAPHEPHDGDTSADDAKAYYAIPRPWGGQWFVQQYQGDSLGFPGFSRTVDVDRFRTTQRGEHGDHVAWLQRKLAHLPDPQRGPLNASGIFDDDTDSAVRALQRDAGLVVDGVVGPRTFAKIAWDPN